MIAPAPAMDSRAALRQAMTTLRAAEVPSHTLAAELLLMHVLGRDRAWIYTHPEDTLEAGGRRSLFRSGCASCCRRTDAIPHRQAGILGA